MTDRPQNMLCYGDNLTFLADRTFLEQIGTLPYYVFADSGQDEDAISRNRIASPFIHFTRKEVLHSGHPKDIQYH